MQKNRHTNNKLGYMVVAVITIIFMIYTSIISCVIL